ncbi:sensor histidine kinase KdpD [Streptomyces sp. AC495_CC817]|uniref:sensor histidine kinase n=1 Tax=Streptomyces sp. AC495_CC817 TaxID=2823900 RepID=UPI001C268DD7|nr:HAMP domain-containing sensor histidine kinase [Streptomyces sp. AC495_CC817]
MTRRTDLTLGILAAIPVGACASAAGIMTVAGDERMLAIQTSLPGSVLIAGALVSAIPLSVLIARQVRRRDHARAEAREIEVARDAEARERANHQRFLARLDHELKNPITAIRATAVAAQDGGQDDSWRTVDAQAAKLSTLVRDLRKLAELETRELELERADLEQVLTEAIAALAQQNPAAGARIALAVTRVPWSVPPLSLDLDLVSLAVDNVLGNAAKYSVHGPIEVRLREHDGWAVIEVADAGRGIPAGDLPAVFDELARAQNARDVSGSGIGLTLVDTVMRRHCGDVSVRSVEGSGTVVTLRLPLGR